MVEIIDQAPIPPIVEDPEILQVLKQWKYLKIILCTAITESGGNLIFYGIEFAINDIGFSYGVDNLLLGSIEIVTAFALTCFMDKVPRKKTIFICYISSGIIGCSFIFPFVHQSKILSSIFIMMLRIFTSMSLFYFSHCLHHDCPHPNLVFPLVDSVYWSRLH